MINRLLLCSFALASIGSSARAQSLTLAQASPRAAPLTAPAIQPLAVQFDLPSKITGRTYRIYVAKPLTPPPKGGWPVIYVLDGDLSFPIAASQMILRMASGQGAAIVVGVGYPQILAASKLRLYDLTPSKPLPGTSGDSRTKPEDYGGAADFHRFMVEELRPQIAALAPVDAANQSLIGYSLGGLFALGVLFDHPDAYRTIVAGSPSIWWNNRELLQKEAGFAVAVRAGRVSTRLLITSGQWEQDPSAPGLPLDPAKRAAELKEMADAKMVDNARGLAARLAAVKGAPGYSVRYVLFPEETHLTGIPASTSRGVAFSFAP